MNFVELEKTMSLEGKVAVVIGDFSLDTIGNAVAEALLDRGAEVVLLELEGAYKNEIKTDTMELTSRTAQEITDCYEQIIKNHGRIDILVNCVNEFYGGTIQEMSEAILEESYQKNVRLAFDLINSVIPYMKEKGGVVVQTTCGAYVSSLPQTAPYASSIYATVRMIKNFADEASRYKIRFNTICAGNIKSEEIERWIEKRKEDGYSREESEGIVRLSLIHI